MEYTAIRILLRTCLEIVYLQAVIRVMHLRSKRLYLAVALADVIIATALEVLDIFTTLNAMGGALFYFVIPVALSVGRLKTRIMQASSLFLIMMIFDLGGGVIYAFLGGGTVLFDHVGPDNILLVITTYLFLISIVFFVYKAYIAHVRNASDEDQPPFENPAVNLIPVTVVLFQLNLVRSLNIGDHNPSPMSILPLFACCWFSLLAIYLILLTARREAEAQRELAEHAIATRRVRHTRREVEGMAWRAEGMSSLRHDLANQVRDIARLAEAGETAEAGRRLSKLSRQARVLSGVRDA